MAELEGDDRILCQVTSRHVRDIYAIDLDESDFEEGSLKQKSNIRPSRIFTSDIRIILYRVGKLKAGKMVSVIERVMEILQS
ncbi:unnamed protein product [marine sediment metagenome]|uniref:Uncharacterized protein n=1 Tax=marine sediment metagenome TaxID=412755 RepID=X1GTL3_9ZZZZ